MLIPHQPVHFIFQECWQLIAKLSASFTASPMSSFALRSKAIPLRTSNGSWFCVRFAARASEDSLPLLSSTTWSSSWLVSPMFKSGSENDTKCRLNCIICFKSAERNVVPPDGASASWLPSGDVELFSRLFGSVMLAMSARSRLRRPTPPDTANFSVII